ncbi:pyridoxal phosphate synthase yaaE subunit [Natranaerovirga pectinivora]|uniref:Pyridoxal 5'-phosphate synthase subunit PdxT n=1 Tax=Natranaerovirga pectinivora TaxID=682400 RepID=A0A4V2UZX6_9FIRM|nr:pyridoxal 5'-phosphate synthase glutaminase subunit PdxT [Natranaerovirga pectinivora]TCT12981.1 pyridoxal phosphate synthase yaaE subunit [Natranaerovirga pectinivora]
MLKIGVLDLQGSVSEHINMLEKLDNVCPMRVKYPDEIKDIDGLIVPGGESTAIGKLLVDFKIKDILIDRIHNGMPIWGTCAGMILLANKIDMEETTHLKVMNITVRRNAYGRQLDSFTTEEVIPEISSTKIPLVFIRAPFILDIGDTVKPLCIVNNNIVAARQDNILVTSFHPELTDDSSVHKYFIEMIN